jgi:hypothetical protein
MAESYWPWRSLRWRDCDGALIGLRRTGEDTLAVLVGSGMHTGKRGTWTDDGRIWGVPDWVWERVGVGESWAGNVVGYGAVLASQEDRVHLAAVGRADPVEFASLRDRSEPLVFERAADGGTQLVEAQAGLTEMTAAMVAGWGWMIFPLPPNSKVPFGGSHAYKDAVASPNAERVRLHWQMWPDDNIALATGLEGSPVVIDIDPRNGGSVEVAEKLFKVRLDYTLSATTPSGGVHLYFTDPLQGKDGALRSVNSGGFQEAPGIEVKSAARHVVMPPSVYRDGMYAWSTGSLDRGPALLPEEVREKAKNASRRTDTFERKEEHGFSVPLESILTAVANSQYNGMGRNNIVHEAACNIALGLTASTREGIREHLQQLREVAVGTELPEYEIDKAIRSAITSRLPVQAHDFLLMDFV